MHCYSVYGGTETQHDYIIFLKFFFKKKEQSIAEQVCDIILGDSAKVVTIWLKMDLQMKTGKIQSNKVIVR